MRFKVKGSSMAPFIKNGDVVTFSPVLNLSIGIGQPVVFMPPRSNSLVVHRIINITRNRYLLKGDNAHSADGLIPKENILGAVTKVERDGREILFFNGPERVLIAFLSRIGAMPFLSRCWRATPFFLRKSIKWKMAL